MPIMRVVALVLFLVFELLAAFGWGKDVPVAMVPLGLACLAVALLAYSWPWPPRP